MKLIPETLKLAVVNKLPPKVEVIDYATNKSLNEHYLLYAYPDGLVVVDCYEIVFDPSLQREVVNSLPSGKFTPLKFLKMSLKSFESKMAQPSLSSCESLLLKEKVRDLTALLAERENYNRKSYLNKIKLDRMAENQLNLLKNLIARKAKFSLNVGGERYEFVSLFTSISKSNEKPSDKFRIVVTDGAKNYQIKLTAVEIIEDEVKNA